MSRTIALLLFTLTGCFIAPRETPIGGHTGGGSDVGTGGGGTGGGAQGGGSAGGQQLADGDATCDQSVCLPVRGDFGALGVPQLTHSGQYLFAVLDRPSEYTGSLVRLDKNTGARRVLYRDESNPLDPYVRVMVRDGFVYFGKTWAGEIWGIVSRTPVGGGAVQELFESSLGGGNPHGVPYDVAGDQLVYVDGAAAYVGTMPLSMSNRSPLYTSTSPIRDVVIAGTSVWLLLEGDGVREVPLAGGAPLTTVPGRFRRLRTDGDAVFALDEAGSVLRLDVGSPPPAAATFPGATDFLYENGKLYGIKAEATATTARLVDPSDVLVFDAPRTAQTGVTAFATAVVDGQNYYLGTNTTLAWLRTTSPAEPACGCAPPAPVIPTEAQACLRNLCSGTTTFLRGMVSGVVEGTHLWGIFNNAGFSGRDLVRYNLAGGGGLVFPGGGQLSSAVGADADRVYYLSSVGDLLHTDKQGNTMGTLVSGVRTYPFEPALAVLDATHAYFASNDGLSRVAKTGGAAETLSTFTDATQLQLDDTHVYWLSKGVLLRVAKTGGTPELLAQDFAFEAGYGLSGAHVYFLTARGLERRRKDGTGFHTLVLAADKLAGLAIERLAVQVSDLLVTTADGALWRLALAGGAREKVLELGPGHGPQSTLVDAKGYALSSWEDTRWRERGCSCAP